MVPGENEKRLKDLELSIDRLRSLYDQFFRGIEKMPPVILQRKVEHEMREMRKERLRNTALRFKLQMQIQRYTAYLSFWQRVMRALELGQMKRGAGVLILSVPAQASAAGVVASLAPGQTGKTGSVPTDEELLDIDIDIDMSE